MSTRDRRRRFPSDMVSFRGAIRIGDRSNRRRHPARQFPPLSVARVQDSVERAIVACSALLGLEPTQARLAARKVLLDGLWYSDDSPKVWFEQIALEIEHPHKRPLRLVSNSQNGAL